MPNTVHTAQFVEDGTAMVGGDVDHLSIAVGIQNLHGRERMVPLPGAKKVFKLRLACDSDPGPN